MIRALTVAVIDQIRTQVQRVYDSDEVPMNPEYPYVVVWSARRYAGDETRRLNDYLPSRGWRFSTMFVGSTADEARFVEEKTELALEGSRVPGFDTTPCHCETSTGVMVDTDDQNIYTGTSVWTFVSTLQPV